MATRIKPDFARRPQFKVSAAVIAKHKADGKPSPFSGFGGDANFLPHHVRNELLEVAKESKLDQAQQEKLIAFANVLAQMPAGPTETNAHLRGQIKKVVSDANRLLEALKVLTGTTVDTLSVYANDILLPDPKTGEPSPLPVDIKERIRAVGHADFMSHAWDVVEGLKIVAIHTNAELKEQASKSGKPLELRQRALVANLAVRYFQLTGKKPPAIDRGWFAKFVRTFGQYMGLHEDGVVDKSKKDAPFIGSRIVKSGIELALNPDTSTDWCDAISASGPPLLWCGHDWPLPLWSPEPQNCRKCGGGRNGAPDNSKETLIAKTSV